MHPPYTYILKSIRSTHRTHITQEHQMHPHQIYSRASDAPTVHIYTQEHQMHPPYTYILRSTRCTHIKYKQEHWMHPPYTCISLPNPALNTVLSVGGNSYQHRLLSFFLLLFMSGTSGTPSCFPFLLVLLALSPSVVFLFSPLPLSLSILFVMIVNSIGDKHSPHCRCPFY